MVEDFGDTVTASCNHGFICIYLKGQVHVTVNKHVISVIYIVAHTCPLCSAQVLVDGENPQ